jgi:hypothetical protein
MSFLGLSNKQNEQLKSKSQNVESSWKSMCLVKLQNALINFFQKCLWNRISKKSRLLVLKLSILLKSACWNAKICEILNCDEYFAELCIICVKRFFGICSRSVSIRKFGLFFNDESLQPFMTCYFILLWVFFYQKWVHSTFALISIKYLCLLVHQLDGSKQRSTSRLLPKSLEFKPWVKSLALIRFIVDDVSTIYYNVGEGEGVFA